MRTEAIDRALRLVCQEMGCDEAYLQLGGSAPDRDGFLSAPTPSGLRLVAWFSSPPDNRESAQLRLKQLADTFFAGGVSIPAPPPDAERQLAQRRLDDELAALAGRTSAAGSTVIDMQSPVIWGCSGPRMPDEDLDTFLEIARLDDLARGRGLDLPMIAGLVENDRSTALDAFTGEQRSRLERLVARLAGRPLASRRTHLLHARALERVRRWTEGLQQRETSIRRLVHEDDLGFFARSFAGIYVLVLYFPGPFSELHVEAAALHSLPVIERHVLGLPPIDPPPPGGNVVRMPVPR